MGTNLRAGGSATSKGRGGGGRQRWGHEAGGGKERVAGLAGGAGRWARGRRGMSARHVTGEGRGYWQGMAMRLVVSRRVEAEKQI